MSFEQPSMSSPEENENDYSREKYESAQKNVHIEQVSLEEQKKRRAERIAEFKKDIKENPMSILTIVDLLPTNLDVILSKRRLSSAEKNVSGLEDKAHEEANELNEKYEELKEEVVKAEKNFKEALQKLADFETGELGMNDKLSESSETK